MKIILDIFLYIWQLPQNIVGLITLLFMRKPTIIHKYRYETIYISDNMKGGITLGKYIILGQRYKHDETTILHERGHAWYSRVFGPLYLIIIGLPSIMHAAFHHCSNYYHFFTEKWADKIMNIIRKINPFSNK